MKKPLYAALDLHSGHSVLGSMDHEGRTQPRMCFPTEANILRAEVERLRRKRQEIGWLENVERARRPAKMPVVLSRPELKRMFAHMYGVPKLMAGLLYGSGLRLMDA